MEENLAPIEAQQISVTLLKACVAAVRTGHVPHLVRALRESGFEHVTESFVRHTGEYHIQLWGVCDPQRKHCFHCGRKTSGALCECVEGMLPRDFVDLRDHAEIATDDPAAVARTFICSCCGQLAVTTCGEVARAQSRGVKLFFPRTQCWRCYSANKNAAAHARREAFEARAAKASPMPPKQKPSQRPKKALKATLAEQLMAKAELFAPPPAQA